MADSRVVWRPWEGVWKATKPDCLFCEEAATDAACTGNASESATIRSCPNERCRVQAEETAIHVIYGTVPVV